MRSGLLLYLKRFDLPPQIVAPSSYWQTANVLPAWAPPPRTPRRTAAARNERQVSRFAAGYTLWDASFRRLTLVLSHVEAVRRSVDGMVASSTPRLIHRVPWGWCQRRRAIVRILQASTTYCHVQRSFQSILVILAVSLIFLDGNVSSSSSPSLLTPL